MDVIEELKKGNFEVFSNLTFNDIRYSLELLENEEFNKKEFYNNLIKYVSCRKNYHFIFLEIFHNIYLNPEYKEETYFLLKNGYVSPSNLTGAEIKELLSKTTWGFYYIYDNIEEFVKSSVVVNLFNIIVEFIKDDLALYNRFLEKVLSLQEQTIRDNFIIASIRYRAPINYNTIIASLYKNPNELLYKQETLPFFEEKAELNTSCLPKLLLFHASNNKLLRKTLIDNFETIFLSEQKFKMTLFDEFKNEIPVEFYNKYKELYRLFMKYPVMVIDEIISIIINYRYDSMITEFLSDKQIDYLNSGTTTHVFTVGDKVLKFSLRKHDINTIKNLYLMAPTEEILIKNNDKIVLYIEIQDFLKKEYDGIHMNEKDVNNLLKELDKMGYVVTDPHCISKKIDNFGFLNSYKDANLDLISEEEIPEWFKKRPIVLYDIDLVYEKSNTLKKEFRVI